MQCLIYCYMNILLKWVLATIKYFYQRKIYIYIYLNSESTQPKVCCACRLQVSKKVKSMFAINIKFFMTSILTLVTWFCQMWYCWKNSKWSIENILILANIFTMGTKKTIRKPWQIRSSCNFPVFYSGGVANLELCFMIYILEKNPKRDQLGRVQNSILGGCWSLIKRH